MIEVLGPTQERLSFFQGNYRKKGVQDYPPVTSRITKERLNSVKTRGIWES